MYEYFLFLAFSLGFIFIVYKNYTLINYYVNRTIFYSQNIKQIKDNMANIDNPTSI
uniref:Uncharacterized protein n=1 Tax=viral metagenome TaxID=1070528 RepID=A0A6C0I040_9ZZZZ